MDYNSMIATIGVGLILMAFFLQTARLIKNNSKTYFVLNAVGAALAFYASVVTGFWTYVILEGAWMLVAVYGLMRTMRIKMT